MPENQGINYPSYVRHCLLARNKQLGFETVLHLLKDLLKLCKDTLRSSRGTTFTSKTGMSILVESYSSGSERNEEVSTLYSTHSMHVFTLYMHV